MFDKAIVLYIWYAGWWHAPMPQNNSFMSPYGPWMGAAPTPNGHINIEKSTDSLEW